MIKQIFLQVGRTHHLINRLKINLIKRNRGYKIRTLLCSVVLLFLSGCSSDINSRSFKFTYSVALEPFNNKKLELWIPVPQSNEVQTISNLNVDSDGLKYEIKDETKHNNKYLYVYSNSGTSEAKTVELSFEVNRIEHNNVDYANVNPDNYLKASSMVPVGLVFNSIIKEHKLQSSNPRGIYDYVLSGMHYGKPTDDKNSGNYKYVHGGLNPKTGKEWLPNNITYGLKKKTRDELSKSQNKKTQYAYGNGNSLYACDIGVGNCTDYHSYFMSLARTLEVPSRFHMGFPIPAGEEGKVKGYHCWADYYVEGEGWYPVDISEADKDPSKIEYFFGTVDESRVEMMVGRDFELDGFEDKRVNLFIYPILEIDDKKSSKFSKSFKYKNI